MSAKSSPSIVIIGAGPTGLGAALRCEDLGHTSWTCVDESQTVGGLSRSFTDDQGFVWDLGGHVIFSHYEFFDSAMDYSTQEWLYHQRESWVRVCGVWVPYPFQNNIHRLPNETKVKCLEGLLRGHNRTYDSPPANFDEFVNRQFGDGVAEIFMRPYNFKVWAVPLTVMSAQWVGERVAAVDVARVCRNIIYQTDDKGWGPNSTFRFPLRGGTGGIWQRLAEKLPQERFRLGSKVVSISAREKRVRLSDGSSLTYDTLISTMPLDLLMSAVEDDEELWGPRDEWLSLASKLVYSSTYVIGLGIRGSPPPHLKTTCWAYFPDEHSPFYRATVFSNYSPLNAPAGHWSLMLEVSASHFKPVDESTVVESCVVGCRRSDLLRENDEIVSTWKTRLERGYPTPFVGRDEILERIQTRLQRAGIVSRGRFGGWKYEVANQDHSLMQGVEAVDAVVRGVEEDTYVHCNAVNGRRNTDRQLSLK